MQDASTKISHIMEKKQKIYSLDRTRGRMSQLFFRKSIQNKLDFSIKEITIITTTNICVLKKKETRKKRVNTRQTITTPLLKFNSRRHYIRSLREMHIRTNFHTPLRRSSKCLKRSKFSTQTKNKTAESTSI